MQGAGRPLFLGAGPRSLFQQINARVFHHVETL